MRPILMDSISNILLIN